MKVVQQIKLRRVCEGHIDEKIIEKFCSKPSLKESEFTILLSLFEGVKKGLLRVTSRLEFRTVKK